jgi:hypothetical protein
MALVAKRSFPHVAPVLAMLLTAAGAAGCATAHARTIGPALDAPAPPPRIVPVATPPIDSQPIVASPPVSEVQTPPPAAIATRPSPSPSSPQTPPAPPAAAAERPPAPPPPTLLTTTDPGAAEQRTRASLANATRDLGRIDVRTLSADARAQYDIAQRFVAQATDALKAKNYEFAQQLADKAATLATLLRR